MLPETRRIIAVDAHRRRTGALPVMVHALGTGESFAITALPDGFTDVASGLAVRIDYGRILQVGRAPIEIHLDGDVGFFGTDPFTGTRFSGRAGGGSTVTIYAGADYFQYAVVTDADQTIIDAHLSHAERTHAS